MYCKWYAEYEGICCNDECPIRADYCPYGIQEECEFYERKGAE